MDDPDRDPLDALLDEDHLHFLFRGDAGVGNKYDFIYRFRQTFRQDLENGTRLDKYNFAFYKLLWYYMNVDKDLRNSKDKDTYGDFGNYRLQPADPYSTEPFGRQTTVVFDEWAEEPVEIELTPGLQVQKIQNDIRDVGSLLYMDLIDFLNKTDDPFQFPEQRKLLRTLQHLLSKEHWPDPDVYATMTHVHEHLNQVFGDIANLDTAIENGLVDETIKQRWSTKSNARGLS